MKDNKNQEIIVGKLVECVDPIEGFLEKNKRYEVLGILEESGRIVINPDARGMEGHYKATRFELVEEEQICS